MKDLTTTATVYFPGGGSYAVTHAWTGIDKKFASYMTKTGKAQAKSAQALGNKGGPLVGKLETIADGVALPAVDINGITEAGLLKFEKMAHKKAGDVIKLGEYRLKQKTAKAAKAAKSKKR